MLLVALATLAVQIIGTQKTYARDASEVTAVVPANKLAHPLDPLSADEFTVLQQVMAEHIKHVLTPKTIIGWAQLREPPKGIVLSFSPGDAIPREALVVAISPENKRSYELTVDLKKKVVTASKEIVNLQPQLSVSEYELANAAVDASPEVAAALEKRGIILNKDKKISEQLYLDPYAPGDEPFLQGKRSMRVLFVNRGTAKNIYGAYIEGLIAFVDLTEGTVSKIQDLPGFSTQKTVPNDIFDRAVLGPQKTAAPLTQQSQKESSEIVRSGNLVTWHDWSFRYSFNQREGLVLHQIGFQDGDRLRSICYRASISEMLVPYSSPSPAWLWREFFDSGEYGLGSNSSAVHPGKEVPAHAITVDALLPGEDGAATSDFADRIFFFERDAGPLLMHKQWTDGKTISARDKQLVIGFVATLGNYDYMFQWVFRLDGSFHFEADLHGLILNQTVALDRCEVCQGQSRPGIYEPQGEERFGTVVAENILGVHHQHWINLRMDFDIDGPVNGIKECATKPLPEDPGTNPNGRAFTTVHKIAGTEKDATSDIDVASNRSWVIYNPSVKSPLGHTAGFEISPGPNTLSAMPESRRMEKVGFTRHHFWATQYKEDELFAAGRYVNQSDREYRDGLPTYAREESVYQQDVVAWYNLGYTHVTRPEDYPIMPAGRVSVHFAPKGFFVKSPALRYATVEEP